MLGIKQARCYFEQISFLQFLPKMKSKVSEEIDWSILGNWFCTRLIKNAQAAVVVVAYSIYFYFFFLSPFNSSRKKVKYCICNQITFARKKKWNLIFRWSSFPTRNISVQWITEITDRRITTFYFRTLFSPNTKTFIFQEKNTSKMIFFFLNKSIYQLEI